MRRGCIVLLLALAGCGRTDAGDSSAGAQTCEGAALEYHGVCFRARGVGVEGIDFSRMYPLEIDGQPGHELIGVRGDWIGVHRFGGDGFELVGEAKAPGEPTDVIAGEFDDVPGLDLAVSEGEEWAALYHLDESGAPTLVGHTLFAGDTSEAMRRPTAFGPDANGRSRIVAHFDDGDHIGVGSDPLALWEVQGGKFVQIERLDLETEACDLLWCGRGDFDGDGRTDAVCSLEDVCRDDPPENDIVHVVLLAQADGTVTAVEHPTTGGVSGSVTDLDGNDTPDLVGEGWYRLSDGMGGLGPITHFERPIPPTLSWSLVSAGDLDGDGDAELVYGDNFHVIVFDDVVGAPDRHERLKVFDAGLKFFVVGFDRAIDVNADHIVDLPMDGWTLLVSELQ